MGLPVWVVVKKIRETQQRVWRGILRIERDRLLAVFSGARVSLREVGSRVMPRFEQRFVRRKARRVSGGLRDELHLQRTGDRLGDVVLNGEDVDQLAVVAFRPQVIAVLGVDELRRHAYAASRAADAAFENVRDAERFRDPADVLFLAAKGEGGRARGDLEAGDVRQQVDDLLGQSVAEVLVVRVAAHVGERQHGDGGSLSGRPGGHLRQRRLHVRRLLEAIAGLFGQTSADDAFERAGAWSGDGSSRRTAATVATACRHETPAGQPTARRARRRSRTHRTARRPFGPEPVPATCTPPCRARCRPSCASRLRASISLARPKSSSLTLPVRGDQDVGRLQVAMQDPLAVRGLERAQSGGQPQRLLRCQRTPRRRALDVLQHQIARADIVDLADVRMVEAAIARASPSNRRCRSGSAANAAGRTLRATMRSRRVSRAR